MTKRTRPFDPNLAASGGQEGTGSLKARLRALERQLDHAQRAYDRNGDEQADNQLRRSIRGLEQQIGDILAELERRSRLRSIDQASSSRAPHS